MLLPSLLSKIDDIESYCLGQIAAQCTNVNGEDCTTRTAAAYTEAISALRTEVTSYYSSAHQAGRSKQLNTIIMTVYQTLIMENLEVTSEGVSLAAVQLANAPTGFSDFRDLFNMGQAGENLLATPSASFWDGCISSAVTNAEEVLLTLYEHIAACAQAEVIDASARDALTHWLQLTNMHNSSIFLFENVTTADNRPVDQKTALGVNIFTTRGAAEIINYYLLDIRIPSYI